MWPPQLLATDSAQLQAASLIQWTIQIGFLLAIILLIILILRKLFVAVLPSYHWMLAKQAIKSTCDTSRSECSCHHHFSRTPPSFRMSTANILGSLKAETFTSVPPHHMCYAWRHKQSQAPLATSSSPHSAAAGSQFHQCLVDSAGTAQIFSPLSPPFNTDLRGDEHFALPESSSNPNKAINWLAAGVSITGPKTDNELDDGSSISNFKFNPNHRSLTAVSYDIPNTTSEADWRNLDEHLKIELQNKHKSPNVPAPKQPTDEASPSSSASNTINRSSGSSTTAQMLSNEASSSFDHSDYLNESSTTPNTPNGSQPRNHIGSSVGSSSSRLSRQRRQMSNLATKQASPLSKMLVAQSQPNSPMFAARFAPKYEFGHQRSLETNPERHYYEEIHQPQSDQDLG